MFQVRDTLIKNTYTALYVQENIGYLYRRCKSVSLVDIFYQPELKEIKHKKW